MLENLGYVTINYSGRGMSGRYCLGIILPNFNIQNILELGYNLGKCNLEEEIPLVKQDDYGKGIVIYFPEIEIEEEEIENEL